MSTPLFSLAEFKQHYQTILPRYTMNPQYLRLIESRLQDALKIRKRVFVMRLDVHFPSTFPYSSISTFLKRFIRKEQSAGYSPTYVWVREYSPQVGLHYHLVLFLNGYKTRQTYPHIQNARTVLDQLVSDAKRNDPDLDSSNASIHDCSNRHNGIMVYRDNYDESLAEVYRQTSYLAKIDQKVLPSSYSLKGFFGSQQKHTDPTYIDLKGHYSTRRISYALCRSHELINSYLSRHEYCQIHPFYIDLPSTLLNDRKLIVLFLQRLLYHLQHHQHDPCYILIRNRYPHTDHYALVLLTTGDYSSWSCLLDVNFVLNHVVQDLHPELMIPGQRYGSDWVHLVLTSGTNDMMFRRSHNDNQHVRWLRAFIRRHAYYQLQIPHHRTFMCSKRATATRKEVSSYV